ncbi:dual specificity protein phosphatase family protein [Candidatus Desantisbacteria bacterium]|nr:dual specificity protein phosphatase family protein [Candidatus Desantisbacteria bacterium]
MKEILKNLYIGNDVDCSTTGLHFFIIHTCKTCHQNGVGYRGNLSSNHPYYLIYESANHLFLNIVDMDRELLVKFTHPIIQSALVFIRKHIKEQKILIHCNMGQSRSPSIGLIYLAQNNIISCNSYSSAKVEFSEIYSDYLPGKGIALYLQKNWEDILKL